MTPIILPNINYYYIITSAIDINKSIGNYDCGFFFFDF